LTKIHLRDGKTMSLVVFKEWRQRNNARHMK